MIFASDWADHRGVKHDARLQGQFNEIVDCITNGWPVPGEYYRSQIDEHGDKLLSELGVKHLHLGGSGSDTILYAVEFDTWVELLEINGHCHLDSEPRGKDLKGQFRAAAAKVVASANKLKPKRSRHRRRKPKNSN